MVCHSGHKYRFQLLVICQFSESIYCGISHCVHIYLCPCFEEARKHQESGSP